MNRPNILYLHSHDTGRCVEPYPGGVPAPNIRRLAGEGILFTGAFNAAPTCSPSRAKSADRIEGAILIIFTPLGLNAHD